MDIPFSRWYSVTQRRRSRRQFNPHRPIDSDSLTALERVCREFTPYPHARACLVSALTEGIFRGIIGGYGKVSGAPAFIAFIGDMRASSVQEEVGYTGEGIILEATALGLNTCWVAPSGLRSVRSMTPSCRAASRGLSASSAAATRG